VIFLPRSLCDACRKTWGLAKAENNTQAIIALFERIWNWAFDTFRQKDDRQKLLKDARDAAMAVAKMENERQRENENKNVGELEKNRYFPK